MNRMSRTGRALAGGLLLAVAAAPAFAAPQDPKLAPMAAPPAAPMTAPPAAQTAAPPAGPSEATAPRISAAELRQALDKGTAVLVDVRAKESYDSGHAQGAISIPLAEIEARAGELPKNKKVVTYCT